MSGNRAIVYHSIKKLSVEKIDYPKLQFGKRPCQHGAILKVVTSNICGSDQHIYRGRFVVPQGTVLGHEITGEIVEIGRDVEFLKVGDLVSVPFNVACGRCRNCKERHTDICENVNDAAPVGAYGFNLGGWPGGQAEYVLVPYADWNLLKFPDKDEAMARILDLTMVSDILPTAFHGCIEAGVGVGSTVYIAGAGPVGRAAAASARLLGASCVIVGDMNQDRLKLVKSARYEVVDLSKDTPLADQIEAILGVRTVDCGVDAVGFEAHGHGPASTEDVPEAVLNDLLNVVRAGGGIGIPGVYVGNDPGAPNAAAKQGTLALDFGPAWIKSLTIKTGMAPIMNYNRQLMMAILGGRLDHLREVMATEVVTLDQAVDAYRTFDEGVSKKYVIDPHGLLKA